MSLRGVKCKAGETWTSARYFQFIRTALRRAFTRYPVKYQVMNAARRIVEGKRHKYEYQCACCNEWFKGTEVQVDHIVGCGSLKEYSDLPRFVETLFCEADNLQLLCKPCHKIKTAEDKENA